MNAIWNAAPKKSIPKAILRRNTFLMRNLSIESFVFSGVIVPLMFIRASNYVEKKSVERELCWQDTRTVVT